MRLIFRPENSPPIVYSFVPGNLMSDEAEAIEELPNTPWNTFEEFGQMFLQGNQKAHRAALWICMKAENPNLEFSSIRYPLHALKITFEKIEAQRFHDSIRANPDLTDAQKDYLISTLDLEIYEGPDGMAAGTNLKDQSPNSGDDDSRSVTTG